MTTRKRRFERADTTEKNLSKLLFPDPFAPTTNEKGRRFTSASTKER